MAMGTEERLDTLENYMKELAYAGRRTEMTLDRLLEERREAEDQWQRDRREVNRKWGELANKMGTLVEDMVLPNFPRILERYFGVTDIERTLPRPKVRHPANREKRREFDLIAYNSDTVFLNETKSSPSAEGFRSFVTDESVFEYFPELAGRKLIRIAAALNMPQDVITYLSRHGCFAMMLGDETMDIVNYREVTGREPPPEPVGKNQDE
ncbi:hypothetical protein [Salinispira pacifica]